SRNSEKIQPDVLAVGGRPRVRNEADETEVCVHQEPGCDDIVGANGEVVRVARSGSGVTAASSKRRQSVANQVLAKSGRLQLAVVQQAESAEQSELAPGSPVAPLIQSPAIEDRARRGERGG